jgi:hypothetical protein
MVRGRKKLPTRLEQDFWERFPELLSDDQEDQHNNLIQKLRKTAQEWFASLEKEFLAKN